MKIDQSTCIVVAGSDVLVTRAVAAENVVGWGVTINPLLGTATIKATVPVAGAATRTPRGTGGDCNEPDPAGATTTPITDSVKVDASWRHEPGSSPLAYGDIDQQGVFYDRDAVASSKVSSAPTGNNVTLRNSSNGWLWSGAWVYASGT